MAEFGHVKSVAVRAFVPGKGQERVVVGYLWESHGGCHFAYDDSYRLGPYSVPLDPERLPLLSPDGETIFSANSFSGPLSFFSRLVPGAASDTSCFAWLSELLCDLEGVPKGRLVAPRSDLTRLAWAGLLQTYQVPLFGLEFAPDFDVPSSVRSLPGLYVDRRLARLWRTARTIVRDRSPALAYNAELLARGAGALSDSIRRWVVPLPGSGLRARFDIQKADGSIVPGYLETETLTRDIRHSRIQYAHRQLARDCGLDVADGMIKIHGSRAYVWSEAVMPPAPPEPPRNAMGQPTWPADEDEPYSSLLPVPAGAPLPYGWHTDPLQAADGWMADTTDPRAYEGHPPATSLIRFAMQAQLAGDTFDVEEAFRRVAFSVLTGLYCLDETTFLVYGRRAAFSSWQAPRRIDWRLGPATSFKPALCPLKTAIQMSDRLLSQAMGYAGRIGVSPQFAASTITRIASLSANWNDYAKAAGLSDDEREPTRPVIAYKQADILEDGYDPKRPRRGRKPTVSSIPPHETRRTDRAEVQLQ